jgi:hypothetical protein
MKDIVLPSDISISRHAAERFLERIIERDAYTAEDVEVAIQIIINILIQRVLHFKRIDQSTIQIKYRNAFFIYDVENKKIITVYCNNNSKEKVEWIYSFPAGLKFDLGISSKAKLTLLTKGFTPIRKEERIIIGQVKDRYYIYDPKYNYIRSAG